MKKVVLITGACLNTGVAIVEKFAAEGWNVVFTGRSPEKVQAAEKAYKEKFSNVGIWGYAIDSLIDERTVDEEAVGKLFAELDTKGIFAETLVLNAADQGLGMAIFENPLTDFMRVINTNMVWNYCLCEQAAKRMKEQDGGNIVFVNSNTAYRAIPNRIAYSASKGGINAMTRALALDLGPFGIRCNVVLPGTIKTERWVQMGSKQIVNGQLTPIGDISDFEDIANAAWYLGSDLSKNVTGTELMVDGGMSCQLYPQILNELKRKAQIYERE